MSSERGASSEHSKFPIKASLVFDVQMGLVGISSDAESCGTLLQINLSEKERLVSAMNVTEHTLEKIKKECDRLKELLGAYHD